MPSQNVYVQTSMGGFTAHDYVCNTIKENGIMCVCVSDVSGTRETWVLEVLSNKTLATFGYFFIIHTH